MATYLTNHKKRDCYHCTACASVCPVHCIEMKKDEEGYLYPEIDEERCIHCHKCEQICIKEHSEKNKNKIEKAYVLYNKNQGVRAKSASGGISHMLMEYVIKNNGVVYGVAYNEKLEVSHMRATDLEECERFKTSKYVNSNIKDIYLQVLEDLQKNVIVLFIGTPCQVAGLKAVVPSSKSDNLLLCEIMCDSVASPILFDKFKQHIEKKYKGKIKNINFRAKDKGAHNKSMKIDFYDREPILMLSSDLRSDYANYMQIFGCGMSAPLSCTECQYEETDKRVSDFTIGDYWGKKEILEDDNKGLSLLLLNSEKAVKIFEEELKDKTICQEVLPMEALDNNHIKPKMKFIKRENFMQDLNHMTFEQLVAKYVEKYRWRTALGKILPKSLKEKVKKMLIR